MTFLNRVYWPSEAATAQLLTDLAEELAANGWPVRVLTTGNAGQFRNGVFIEPVSTASPHLGFVSQAANYWRFLSAARRGLRANLVPGDIVVAMTDPPLLAPAIVGPTVRRTAHLVHWVQDIYPEIVPAHAGRWLHAPLAPVRWIRNRAWRSGSACVIVGGDMATVTRSAGVPASRVHVIPNWAPRELEKRAAQSAIGAVRLRWGVNGKFAVVYSGNLGRVHEFDTLLGAAAALKAHDDIVFLFVGGGPRLAKVRAAAEREPLPNVRFHPASPRSELAANLAAADAHLVTLHPEFTRFVSPSKIAGVMAASRPALFVGNRDSGIAKLLESEACGMAFASGDAAGLARAILQLKNEPGECARLGNNARRHYESRFTLEAAADRWAGVLEAVAAG